MMQQLKTPALSQQLQRGTYSPPRIYTKALYHASTAHFTDTGNTYMADTTSSCSSYSPRPSPGGAGTAPPPAPPQPPMVGAASSQLVWPARLLRLRGAAAELLEPPPPLPPSLPVAWPSEAAARGEAPLLQSEVLAADVYLRRLAPLPPRPRVVDVGACVGLFALRCLLRPGRPPRIVAIEPAPACCGCLMHNVWRLRRAASEALPRAEVWENCAVAVLRDPELSLVAAAVGARPTTCCSLQYDAEQPGESTLFPSRRAARRSATLAAARQWLYQLRWRQTRQEDDAGAVQRGATAGRRQEQPQSAERSKPPPLVSPSTSPAAKRRPVESQPPRNLQAHVRQLLRRKIKETRSWLQRGGEMQPAMSPAEEAEALLQRHEDLDVQGLMQALEQGIAELEDAEHRARQNGRSGAPDADGDVAMPDEQQKEEQRQQQPPQMVKTPMVTLAQVARHLRLECIDVLKIDCEGCELEVLQGMTASTWAMTNQIVAEAEGVDCAKSIHRLLQEHGFEAFIERQTVSITSEGFFSFTPSSLDLFYVYGMRPEALDVGLQTGPLDFASDWSYHALRATPKPNTVQWLNLLEEEQEMHSNGV